MVLRTSDSPRATVGGKLRVTAFAPALGAEVRGIDLANGLDVKTYQEVRAAFLQYGVLFFKEQSEIPPSIHVAIGRMFGELHMHPAAPQMPGHPEVFIIHAHRESKVANGEFWHSDVSCDEVPPLGTMLQIHVLPDIGGDTLFANMYAAYDALSAPIKQMLVGLTARHESEHVYRGRYGAKEDDRREYPKAEHPVIRTHPVSGRKALFVNRGFTTRIVQLKKTESAAVLELLYRHVETPELHCRFRWQPRSVAFWDNRGVQHHAMWDYFPRRRHGFRVTVKGDRPFFRA